MGRVSTIWEVLFLGFCFYLQLVVAGSEDEEDIIHGAIHTIFSTDCEAYFSFQALAVAHSFAHAGQPGNLTRIASCTEGEARRMDPEEIDAVQTHFAPSWSVHHITGDAYLPYNKPTGIIDWLEQVNPREEWLLLIDADMIFRHPVTPETLGLTEGWAAGSYYNYLKGVNNALAERHIPEVKRRNDTYGGPRGRRADKVGAFVLVRNADMRRIAPLWLKYTEEIRADPDAWSLTGDAYAKPGEPVWISEMYGYAFAAASVGVWHKLDPGSQSYAEYSQLDVTKLVHYGLDHRVLGYTFDKHNHEFFESFKCPPWNMSTNREMKDDGGLFPHPPQPAEVEIKDVNERYGALLVIEFVNTLNEALCERHMKNCPFSEELEKECNRVAKIREALTREYDSLDLPGGVCRDDPNARGCPTWESEGECTKNWLWTATSCRLTCGYCYGSPAVKNPQIAGESFSKRQVPEMTGNGALKPPRPEASLWGTEHRNSAKSHTQKRRGGESNNIDDQSNLCIRKTCLGTNKEDKLLTAVDGKADSNRERDPPSMYSEIIENAEQNMDGQNREEINSIDVTLSLNLENAVTKLQIIDDQHHKANGVQRDRLVGSSGWDLFSSGISTWGILVCFFAFCIWRSTMTDQERHRARKRLIEP